jgi:hypothetical protein
VQHSEQSDRYKTPGQNQQVSMRQSAILEMIESISGKARGIRMDEHLSNSFFSRLMYSGGSACHLHHGKIAAILDIDNPVTISSFRCQFCRLA